MKINTKKLIEEGFVDNIKNHLRNNAGKYALGTAAAGGIYAAMNGDTDQQITDFVADKADEARLYGIDTLGGVPQSQYDSDLAAKEDEIQSLRAQAAKASLAAKDASEYSQNPTVNQSVTQSDSTISQSIPDYFNSSSGIYNYSNGDIAKGAGASLLGLGALTYGTKKGINLINKARNKK